MAVSRSWCFTKWSPIDVSELDMIKIRYMVWQEEMAPDTGRIHYQGYIELNKAQRISGVKKLLSDSTMHLEQRRGNREGARAYCMKDDSRTDGPWEIGTWIKGQGARTDIHDFVEIILDGATDEDLIRSFPGPYVKYNRSVDRIRGVMAEKKAKAAIDRDVKVIVLIGKTGVGKTHLAFEIGGGYESTYRLPYVARGRTPWFDGYRGEDTLLIDDYEGEIDYRYLLQILDKYPLQLQVKGSFTWALWHTVVITSNVPVKDWYPDRDVVTELRRRITDLRIISSRDDCDEV